MVNWHWVYLRNWRKGKIEINVIILSILLPYEGDSNLFGLFFHILYHNINQDPILNFFPFFLFGTIIGDTLFHTLFVNQSEEDKKRAFGHNFLIPSILCGIFLIAFGILLNFPRFLMRRSFSWAIYSIGIDVVLISIFLIFEVFEIIRPHKSYKFLFYYSYYSLTIYLAHNFLYFQQLNVINIWFFIAGAFIFMGILLRIIFKTWEGKASIKVQIGKLSLGYALKVEERLQKRYNKINIQ